MTVAGRNVLKSIKFPAVCVSYDRICHTSDAISVKNVPDHRFIKKNTIYFGCDFMSLLKNNKYLL